MLNQIRDIPYHKEAVFFYNLLRHTPTAEVQRCISAVNTDRLKYTKGTFQADLLHFIRN